MRKLDPRFTGFIPDEPQKRLKCYITMMASSFGCATARTCSCAIIAYLSLRVYLFLVVVDVVGYLGVKRIREDYYLWRREWTGAKTMALRVMEKILNDYAFIVSFRHPRSMGGTVWGLNICVGVGYVVGAIVALREVGGEDWTVGDGGEIGWRGVACGLGVVVGIWGVAFGIFYWNVMEPVKRIYFLSGMTSREFHASQFSLGNDEVKAFATFMVTEDLWKEIRGEVEKWCKKRWLEWENEHPEWFEVCYDAIPTDFMPKSHLTVFKGKKNMMRR